ncbi:MAG TPA: hypothetical protein VHO29_06415 [Marmoricola sp.]|nr:hypothetical protein [Marmoricola sp.]
MTRLARVLAVGLVAALGLFGALFIAGETLADPGGWQGIGLVGAWAVPMGALTVLALRQPAVAGRVLPWALLVAGVLLLADAAGAYPRDAGPVGTITMFAVVVPSGLLGLHRAFLAGVLVLAAGATQLGAALVERGRSGAGLEQVLGGSTGAFVVPFLVCAVLLLLTAALERHDAHHPHLHAVS